MKKATKVISPANSFQGWEFGKFLKGLIPFWSIVKPTVKETLIKIGKEFVKFAVPAVISFVSVKNPALASIATLVGKAILDNAEFFFKKIEAKPVTA